MTIVAERPAVAERLAAHYFAHTWLLTRMMMRRERLAVVVTVVLFVVINIATAASIAASYSTPQQRLLLITGPGSNTAFRFLLGPLEHVDSTASLTVWRAGLFMVAALAVCAALMVVRQTRKEEELGRTELIRSGATGILAASASAAIVSVGFCVIVALGMSLMLIPLGAGSADAGLGVVAVFAQYASTGAAAVGIALVTAQFAATSHIANLAASAVILVGYLLRGVGDAIGGWSWLRWITPMGWAQLIDPYGANNLWYALASFAFCAVGAIIAGWIALHRDLGSGLIHPRPGPAGTTRLGSIGAVVSRLNRTLLASWCYGIGVYALIVGFMQPSVDELAEGNEQVNRVLRESGLDGTLTDLFGFTMLSFLAVAASAWPVNLAERMRGEESAGRTEELLGTPLSRTRFYLAHVIVATLGVIALLLVAASAITIGNGIAGGGWATPAAHAFNSASVQIPAALVIGTAGIALYGVKPALVHAGWLVVVGALFLGPLSGMFDLPGWLTDLSPFTHTPAAPLEPVRALPIVVMLCVAALFTVAGLISFRRRNIG